MIKKTNARAHKKALKKSLRKNNRNIYGKEQKRIKKSLEETFDFYQFLEAISKYIDKTKAIIDASLLNFKLKMKGPIFKEKLKGYEKNDLEDLIRELTSRENISAALAMVIFCNCLVSINSHATTLQSQASEEIKQASYVSSFSEASDRTYNLYVYYDIPASEPVIVEEIEEETVEEPVVLTNAEKIIIILDKYDITHKQFKEIVATVLLEGGRTIIKDAEGNIIEVEITHYDECYNITSTMFNRICSASCISFVDNKLGPGTGINIYNQVICPGQYTVSRSEVQKLADTDLSIYAEAQAVIDMLYSSNPSTDFYRFYNHKRQDLQAKYHGIQLCPPYGNCYHAEVKDYDRVDPADTLPNYAKYVEVEENVEPEDMGTEERTKSLTLKPNEGLANMS